MALVYCEAWRGVVIIPDPSLVTYVAKVQKTRTRKNRNYFVLRTTMPKDVAEKIGAMPGDYLLFKAKKAEWFDMLDWKSMENTWKMLPDNIRNHVVRDGLYYEGTSNQMQLIAENMASLGATNQSAAVPQLQNAQKPCR